MSDLIPVSRKEQYLSKIDGMTNKSPDKTYTKEEYFFSEILGEALHKPVLETRYEMYLAKIAGREIGIPYPETRLELFLARACGMDIETPTPITREEIFWSNYSAIVDFEVEGTPPLTYKAVAGTLKDYRIYGNTAGGESVGDRTKNLWNGVAEQGSISTTGDYSDDSQRIRSRNIALTPGTYSISCNLYIRCIYAFNGQTKVECVKDLGGGAIQSAKFTVPDNADNVSVGLRAFDSNNQPIDVSPSDFEWGQIEQGSTVTTYEPYGYRVPVSVTNGTDTEITNIYLPEQIRKVGDEAEYIDYGEQKFVKKFYKLTLNFDDMNNEERYPGWQGGTALVEYCNKIRSSAIGFLDGYTPMQCSSISNFKAMFNVRSNNSVLFLGNSSDIGHTQSELKEIYAGRSITFILKIPDTDLDVTLPALPTLRGTNVLSVETEVQPSKVYIKGEKEREDT